MNCNYHIQKKTGKSINTEDARVVTAITRSNSARTSTYCGPEVNDFFLKPADLIKQKADMYVSGELISKERISLEDPL